MLKKILVIGLLLSGGLIASAETKEKVKESLSKALPEITIDKMEKSQVPGFYQVESGAEIFYVSEDGKYLFAGNVIDVKTKSNITENAKNSLRLSAVNRLPANAFINFTPKDKKYRVVVFTDVDCPYCRKLHEEIKGYDKEGIEISYVPFPRAGLDSPSYYKAAKIWCSSPEQARELVNSAKLKHDRFKASKADVCKNSPVAAALEVVRELHLNGTPSMLLPNGTVVPGYVPPKRLVEILKEEDSKE